MDAIEITGAKEHNLKNVNIVIPRNKMTSLVGVSGSGKSTVAFDIIFSEGQRQFLGSLDTYAARLLQKTERPNIDTIKGLSPTIMIEQRQLRESPRSTVGTATEIYTYLRLLFSRAGSGNLSAGHFSFNNPLGCCEKCKGLGTETTIDPNSIVDFEKTLTEGAIKHTLFKPGGRYLNILKTTAKVDFNKPIKDFSKSELDFLLYSPQVKLRNASQGFVQSYSWEGVVSRLVKRAEDKRGISATKSKLDAPYWIIKECSACGGARLNKKALAVTVNGNNIGYFASLPITDLIKEIIPISGPISKPIVKRMKELLEGLISVGIGYVSLNRSTNTLSAGEAQRIKLARELGSELIETIYILDEPTAGLHPRDVGNIIGIMKKLRDAQNTVIVVEHDANVMLESDYLIELGPGAGKYGGEIVAVGTANELTKNAKSLTGKYLSGKMSLTARKTHRKPTGQLEIKNASLHNLRNISVRVPTGVFTAVTGVSGSGKSSLINDIFVQQYRNRVISVDQSPVGSSPRGNIATYTGAFDIIRGIIAKENGVDKALFTSNGRGACPDCEGLGYNKIDMHFMAPIKVVCETCNGQKYKMEVLKYRYKGKNISEILNMTAEEALAFFDDNALKNKLKVLTEIGLSYLDIGQTLDTLSGGESQRLKLAERLHKRGEFFVLDEPTAGLHFADVDRLLNFLHRLVDAGNSVLTIEHNLDVIASADWVIDLGPEGGDKGGSIIAEGTPEEVANIKSSYTGQFLKKYLQTQRTI